MNEIWKNIDDFEGLYQVSNLGNVKSLNYNHTGKELFLKPGTDKYGYLYVLLYKNGKPRHFKIHRLVAKAFLENPYNKPEVNHKDEDKTNNCLTNLEWMTSKENINYGTHNERAAKSRINHQAISKSVLQYSLDGEFIKEWPSTMQIERELGFSSSNISECCNGKQKTSYRYIWKYA